MPSDPLTTYLTRKAPEEGFYPITVSYLDEDDAPVTPTAATWTLTDERGRVINERSAEVISSLSTSNVIGLQGDDLSIGDNGTERLLLVEYTYDSDLGDDLPGISQAHFVIENFAGKS
jgi:hypothetical protein